MKKTWILALMAAGNIHAAIVNHKVPNNNVWSALSMLESGDNDFQIGTHGEVSRYQILPREWKRFGGGPLKTATDPGHAKQVAMQRMQFYLTRFNAGHHRAPNSFEFYVLWNAPAQTDHARLIVTERAQRFANLCSL